MEAKSTPSVVSMSHSIGYYQWGKNSEAWNLVDNQQLSVKLEKMPGGTEELLHYHKECQQFFYILEGKAVFEVDEVILIVHRGEGLQIEANRTHKIMNKEQEPLTFLVCSQPATTGDRHNLV